MKARDVLGAGGLFARVLPGHEHRDGQLEMAALVEASLAHDGVALIEAGTGTGKTFAYLVPAILSGKKVIVSTGTKTLQDQIAEHDVPKLGAALREGGWEAPISLAVLKGLPSYVCRRRHAELSRSAVSVTDRGIARSLPLIDRLVRESGTGDRAELPELSDDDPVWGMVASGSDTRIGPRCAYHDECFVTRARARAEKARIVVVNHHLFFADLALRAEGRKSGGRVVASVLPDYDAVIFDEAHQLEDVCAQFFGVSLSTGRVEAFARDAEHALSGAMALDDASERMVVHLRVRAEDFFELLPRGAGANESRTPVAPDLGSPAAKHALYALDAALEALTERCRSLVGEGEVFAMLARRGDRLRDAVGALDDLGSGARVGWSSREGASVTLGATPVDVSSILKSELFLAKKTVVLTSATLTTQQSFAFVRARLGIDFEVDEAMVPSPFDWASQALLHVPPLPDRRGPEFLRAAQDEILALVRASGGGALVLCTSRQVMNDLSRALAGPIARLGLPTRVQGQAPKSALLAWLRAAEHGVLFATQSFWEGVDVPGHALRLVIIDRLPFDPPSDPLVEARTRRLASEGREPFMEYLVPSAALALKQGFGRLVRSREDRGVVSILDTRIVEKGYGQRFLASLPPVPLTRERADVEAFFARLRPGADAARSE
jgi:ATP-dependent DNA helicase DinG